MLDSGVRWTYSKNESYALAVDVDRLLEMLQVPYQHEVAGNYAAIKMVHATWYALWADKFLMQ